MPAETLSPERLEQPRQVNRIADEVERLAQEIADRRKEARDAS